MKNVGNIGLFYADGRNIINAIHRNARNSIEKYKDTMDRTHKGRKAFGTRLSSFILMRNIIVYQNNRHYLHVS